jgi:ABC-type phosphate/phosphonate transport system substrate-binding protein
MLFIKSATRRPAWFSLAILAVCVPLLGLTNVLGHQGKSDLLRIGSSGSLTASSSDEKEADALKTLREFIKDETGMENTIVNQKNWQTVVDKLKKQELQIGIFQGFEFAWAQEKDPGLRPLMLAVKVHRFPKAYVVTNKDNKASDLGGLAGQSLAIPSTSAGFPQFFVEREALARGKKLEAFFSKITKPEEPEEAIDDVVDGVVAAAVVDQATLEAFREQKSGRFARLKAVAQSQPYPSPVIAYQDKELDGATLTRFRNGLIKASTKERGRRMLNMFHLKSFETIPNDFVKVLAETGKKYPVAPEAAK